MKATSLEEDESGKNDDQNHYSLQNTFKKSQEDGNRHLAAKQVKTNINTV